MKGCGSMEGKKYDEGKLRWDLLPVAPVKMIVMILTFGAKKYGDNNWQGVSIDRYYAALCRHLIAWREGEKFDDESKIHHLAHVMVNAMFIVWKEFNQAK